MEKLTLEEKARRKQAVAVAKDVLKSINTVNPVTGDYLSATIPGAVCDTGDSKQIAKALKKHCEACALGSLLISVVSLHNEFNFHYSDYGKTRGVGIGASTEVMRVRLRQVFSRRDIALIETAFETNTSFAENENLSIYDSEVGAADTFGRQYKTDKGRLRAIMNNIIDNKGAAFIPSAKARAQRIAAEQAVA